MEDVIFELIIVRASKKPEEILFTDKKSALEHLERLKRKPKYSILINPDGKIINFNRGHHD